MTLSDKVSDFNLETSGCFLNYCMTDRIDTYLMTKRSQLIQIYIQDTFRHRHFFRHLDVPNIVVFSHFLFHNISNKYSTKTGTVPLPNKSLCQIFPKYFFFQTFRFSDQVHSTSNMCNWEGLKQHFWILHEFTFLHFFVFFSSFFGNTIQPY